MIVAKSIGVLVTLVVIAASAAMNYHYMAQEGAGLAGHILGVVSVAFDVIKALLPIYVVAAMASGAWVRAGLGSVFLVLFLAFGLASALGFGEGSKGGRAATRDGLNATLASVDGELTALRDQTTALPIHRPLGTVEAALTAEWATAVIDGNKTVRGALGAVSKQCTVVTGLTKEGCDRVGGLRQELAAASEGARLQRRGYDLEAERRRLLAAGAGQDADPQASVIARLIGRLLPDTDHATIRSGIVTLFAVLIEGWSAFGLYLCGVRHSVVLATPGVSASPLEPIPLSSVAAPTAPLVLAPLVVEPLPQALAVADWALDRLQFEQGARLQVEHAFADYRGVAAAAGQRALRAGEFRRALLQALLEIDCEVWGDMIDGVTLSAPTETKPIPDANVAQSTEPSL